MAFNETETIKHVAAYRIFQMKNILYVYPVSTSFVRIDADLLSQNYNTINYLFDVRRKWMTPFIFIRQFLFLIFKIWKMDAVVCHFAGYHSFLPVVFSKLKRIPCIIILAGTDCVSFPSIHYGNFNKWLLGRFTKWSIKWCDHRCPVHKSLVLYNYTYTNDDYPFQGYEYFCNMQHSKYFEIPYGYDYKKFFSKTEPRLKNSFLTVTQSTSGTSFYRKGIDLILNIAKYFPDYHFAIVGNDNALYNQTIPENVILLPAVPFEELVHFYNQYEFYLQLSLCEGFPNALCEAMLCGCIPIGSRVAAIPDIIATTGFILNHKDIEELKIVLNAAVNSDKKMLSAAAQNRIRENFTLEKRGQSLYEVIDGLKN